MAHEQDLNPTTLILKSEDRAWRFIRRLAFAFDPERMHETAISLLKLRSLCTFGDVKRGSIARDPVFKKSVMGLSFPNPIGLAAGFDVDGECLPALQYLGFGFIEVGGITENAQPGNDRPRIFRLPEDKAIINRLNFYNKGAHRLRSRLSLLRERNRLFVPIGVNLGKSNFSTVDEVPKEYLRTFQLLCDVADYVTINVSCPNSEGLFAYQTTKRLGALLDTVCSHNETLRKPVPLLLKLGPDLTNEEAIACAEIALEYRLSGLVISNTTIKRNGLSKPFPFGCGGLSGKPLFERSTQLLRCIAKDYGGKLALLGSGGIMEGSQALEKLNAGADLLQIYTGFIYGGPNFVYRLLQTLRINYFQ